MVPTTMTQFARMGRQPTMLLASTQQRMAFASKGLRQGTQSQMMLEGNKNKYHEN